MKIKRQGFKKTQLLRDYTRLWEFYVQESVLGKSSEMPTSLYYKDAHQIIICYKNTSIIAGD